MLLHASFPFLVALSMLPKHERALTPFPPPLPTSDGRSRLPVRLEQVQPRHCTWHSCGIRVSCLFFIKYVLSTTVLCSFLELPLRYLRVIGLAETDDLSARAPPPHPSALVMVQSPPPYSPSHPSFQLPTYALMSCIDSSFFLSL